MEIAGAATGGVANIAAGHADREINYLFKFRENIKALKIKARQLASTRDDLQLLVDVAQCNGELIKKTVTDWLDKVEGVLNKATRLDEEAGEVDKWHKGWTSSRFSLGRKAVKKIAAIEVLLDDRSKFESIAEPKLFQRLELVTSGDFDAFASRKHTTKEILEALKEKEVKLIGIFGMPGVGKTMLMQAIARQVKEEKQFDEVVMVTVSQNPDVKKVQKEIAAQMDLTLNESSIIAAAQLSERLSRDKKILVALDDMWERLDFAEVGIPHKSNIQVCKVLFTTRRRVVCDQMETDASIGVEVLSDEDSWKLFRQKAGTVVDSSSHQEIAREAVNECKCLPIAIATLGLALRNKDEIVWSDALTQLRNSDYEGMEGMDVVISMVKLSYQFLQSESDRMCFLFCSFFPEDFRIESDVLLIYMLGEKLLKNADTIGQARRRLHAIVEKLTSSGLLLRVEKGNIMMHDVIRDAAIRIASNSEECNKFVVKSGLGLSHWPGIELQNCKRLSLMVNDLRNDDLPQKIVAPHLLTLSFLRNFYLNIIPYDFFLEMKNLRTLDLSETNIEFLPPSFKYLENLCTLRMDHCFLLTDISPIEWLERLEILTIRDSVNVRLPEEMWVLSNLKMFDASNMTRGGLRPLTCPSDLISSLYRLEELYLSGRTFSSSFIEITSLTRLICLEIYLPVESLSLDFSDLWSPNLSTFKIVIGRSEALPSYKNKGFNEINFYDLRSSVPVPNWLLECLERTDVLGFCGCESIDIVAEFGAQRMAVAGKPLFNNLQILDLQSLEMLEALYNGKLPHGFLCKLQWLRVEACHKIRILISRDLLENLQNLEVIVIDENSELEEIIQFEDPSMSKKRSRLSTFPSSSFLPNLTDLYVMGCNKLKCIIPLEVAQGLSRLKTLKVKNCLDLKMIFEDDREKAYTGNMRLPCLEKLKLNELPSLSSIGPPSLLVDFPSLVKLQVYWCWNLKTLFLGCLSVPKLKTLDVKQDWFDNLEWGDESLKFHLQSLIPVEDREASDRGIHYKDDGTEEDEAEGEFDYEEDGEVLNRYFTLKP